MSSSDDSSERRANQRKNMRKKSDEWGEQNSIAGQILRVIKQCSENPHGMHQVRQHKALKLKIIQKKPLYLSDGTHCIQSSRQPLPKIEPNPFNTLQTQFYAGHSKPHIVFNCHDQIVEQQRPLYPSAYHPAYHYKSYEQFEQRRKTTQVLVSCEKIQVTCWSIHIVNISKSGYYGPVLVIHDSRKGKGENIVLKKRVQNILFYQQISPYLDDFRVRDMRKINLTTLKNQFSLVYYIRDRKGNKKTEKLSNFSSLDTKNSILDSNPNLAVKFITFGQMSQYEIFKRPIHPKYLDKRKQINLDMYMEQNKNKRIDRNQANESEDDINSNSSSFIQDYNYNYHQNENQNQNQNQRYMMEDEMQKQNVRDANYQQIGVEDEDDQIDEEDDYLKKVYEKAMKNSSYM